jgi:hypothetical protein
LGVITERWWRPVASWGQFYGDHFMSNSISGWYVSSGTPELHLKDLQKAADHGSVKFWTVNSKARPRDRVIFYLLAPLSSFVATGTVASPPEFQDKRGDDWYGHYMADIKDIRMLARSFPLTVARTALPEWGWLKYPRRSTRVPSDVAPRLLKLLRVPDAIHQLAAEATDVEGVTTETRVFRRGRSRFLRELALDHAKGVCAVCRRDFSKVLSSQGVRVLQVHHRQQLAASDAPRVTKLTDLAVVCANCHLLIHLDPRRAMRVELLRRRLASDK